MKEVYFFHLLPTLRYTSQNVPGKLGFLPRSLMQITTFMVFTSTVILGLLSAAFMVRQRKATRQISPHGKGLKLPLEVCAGIRDFSRFATSN